MVKIKRKVEMILPELIEWGFKQKELLPFFYGSREGSFVQFTPDGWVNITGIESTDTFTVEVEKEITEETKLPKCLEIYFDDKIAKADEINVYMEKSISEILQESKRYQFETKAIYLFGDNGNLTPIWKDGKLVGDE